MTSAALFRSTGPDGLQPVDLGRHLGRLADLIEVCFGHEMDAAGRGVIAEMRFLGHLGPALTLLNGLGLGQLPWGQGYVWVEAGQVVGSVSTQHATADTSTWLVANVAVHPGWRRRGLATALMRATLDLLRARGARQAILQVDDHNLGAFQLYRRLGFQHVATHTAWRRPPHLGPPPPEPPALDVRRRARGEWADQLALATRVRPEGLAWNHPLCPADFAPSFGQDLARVLSGQGEEHWLAFAGGLAGSLSVRTNLPEGDRLTLLAHPDRRGQVERLLLVRGLRRLENRPWPVHLEHPADDQAAEAALRGLGFQPLRCLRWMQLDLAR